MRIITVEPAESAMLSGEPSGSHRIEVDSGMKYLSTALYGGA